MLHTKVKETRAAVPPQDSFHHSCLTAHASSAGIQPCAAVQVLEMGEGRWAPHRSPDPAALAAALLLAAHRRAHLHTKTCVKSGWIYTALSSCAGWLPFVSNLQHLEQVGTARPWSRDPSENRPAPSPNPVGCIAPGTFCSPRYPKYPFPSVVPQICYHMAQLPRWKWKHMFCEPKQHNVNTGYTLLHATLQCNMRRAHESLTREQLWHLPQKYLHQHWAGKKRSKRDPRIINGGSAPAERYA